MASTPMLVRTLSLASRGQASRSLSSWLSAAAARQRCCHLLPVTSNCQQVTTARNLSLNSLFLRSTHQDVSPPSKPENEVEHEFVPEEHDDPEMTIYHGILS